MSSNKVPDLTSPITSPNCSKGVTSGTIRCIAVKSRTASVEGIDVELSRVVVGDNYGALKLSVIIDREGVLLAVSTLLGAYTREASVDGCVCVCIRVRVLGESRGADERCEKEDEEGLEELHFL